MNVDALVGFGSLWVAVPVAVLAGLLSFLSPCVLPLVPGYLGFLGGAVSGSAAARTGGAEASSGSGSAGVATVPATATRGQLVAGVLLFIGGFTAVFVVVIVLGGTVGLFFLQWSDVITRVLGVIVILLGLVFIGLFGVAQRTMRMNLTGRAGLVGAPLLGVALGVGWTPCMGPTLGAIMAVAVNLGDPGRAAILGLAYSLGLGIPFLLVALGFGWATRSVGFLRRHVRTVNIIGGVLLILLGVLMVAGVWTDLMSRLGAVMSSVQLPL